MPFSKNKHSLLDICATYTCIAYNMCKKSYNQRPSFLLYWNFFSLPYKGPKSFGSLKMCKGHNSTPLRNFTLVGRRT